MFLYPLPCARNLVGTTTCSGGSQGYTPRSGSILGVTHKVPCTTYPLLEFFRFPGSSKGQVVSYYGSSIRKIVHFQLFFCRILELQNMPASWLPYPGLKGLCDCSPVGIDWFDGDNGNQRVSREIFLAHKE